LSVPFLGSSESALEISKVALSAGFIKIFPAGIFGVCLFNLVARLALERMGLASTIGLGYGVAWARGRSG
jgi:hypothetical protein